MADLADFKFDFIALSLNDAQHPMKVLRILPSDPYASGRVLIVIQEIFGINDSLKKTCAEFAQQGFTVLCPDLFHRLQADVNLVDSNPKDLEKAFSYFKQFDVDQGIKDIQHVINYARHNLGSLKVGAVGYCLGGYLAYLVSCRTDIDVCVSYYGVNIHNALDDSDNICRPLLLHIAALDEFVPAEAQKMITTHFSGHNYVLTAKYPNVQHGFARVDGMHFDQHATDLANSRTQEILSNHLNSDALVEPLITVKVSYGNN